ncbi:MAG: SocA family protein [Prevotellaceae bacterium]|nr:SocA family protein [Prevotellaceae bacterium]
MTTPIFDPERAVEATLFVANRLETPDFHKIFKILYFADRDHLVTYGRVITGDTYIKMKKGPVPTHIYDGFKALRSKTGGLFHSAAEAEKDTYILKPLRDYLPRIVSQSDVEKLSASIGRYGAMQFDQLTSISHAQAWNAAKRNRAIALEDIMREAGSDEGFIEYITEDINASKAICGYGAE